MTRSRAAHIGRSARPSAYSRLTGVGRDIHRADVRGSGNRCDGPIVALDDPGGRGAWGQRAAVAHDQPAVRDGAERGHARRAVLVPGRECVRQPPFQIDPVVVRDRAVDEVVLLSSSPLAGNLRLLYCISRGRTVPRPSRCGRSRRTPRRQSGRSRDSGRSSLLPGSGGRKGLQLGCLDHLNGKIACAEPGRLTPAAIRGHGPARRS